MAEIVISDNRYAELGEAATAFAEAAEDMRERFCAELEYVLGHGGIPERSHTAQNLVAYIAWADGLKGGAEGMADGIAASIAGYIAEIDAADQEVYG